MTTIEIVTVNQHHLLFDQSNPNWHASGEHNFAFIKTTAQYLQKRLAVRDHLFVNEVLDAFGFDRTPDGQVSGWLRRDGYIAIDAIPNEGGNPAEYWIKFDVQGVIVNDI